MLPDFPFQSIERGGDFGLLLTAAGALSEVTAEPDDLGHEALLVFRAGLIDDRVAGALRRKRLEQLLEAAFWIGVGEGAFEPLEVLARFGEDDAAHGDVIAVEIHGADERLVGVGEGGGALTAAAGFLAASHHEIAAEIDIGGVHTEAFATDELGAQFGEVAFRVVGEMVEEVLGKDELEDGVAEELQALIIEMVPLRFVAQTGMRERLREEERVAELVVKALFERVHAGAENKRAAEGELHEVFPRTHGLPAFSCCFSLPAMSSLAAITGARGWLGSCVTACFRKHGWSTRGLVREPASADEQRLVLGEEIAPGVLEGAEALVHCAWDFRARTWPEIMETNVRGTEALLRAAAQAGVRRLVYISTMSAFPGCRSLYGRAKLEGEKIAAEYGALIVRPGLITGQSAGGMVGSLVQQVRSGRFLPLIAGDAVLYAVHEEDLTELIFRFCAGGEPAPARPLVAAHPEPWPFRRLLREIARREGRRPVLVPIPWRVVWLGLRTAEVLGLRLGFRSDSVVSLANQDPHPDFSTHAAAGFFPRGLT